MPTCGAPPAPTPPSWPRAPSGTSTSVADWRPRLHGAWRAAAGATPSRVLRGAAKTPAPHDPTRWAPLNPPDAVPPAHAALPTTDCSASPPPTDLASQGSRRGRAGVAVGLVGRAGAAAGDGRNHGLAGGRQGRGPVGVCARRGSGGGSGGAWEERGAQQGDWGAGWRGGDQEPRSESVAQPGRQARVMTRGQDRVGCASAVEGQAAATCHGSAVACVGDWGCSCNRVCHGLAGAVCHVRPHVRCLPDTMGLSSIARLLRDTSGWSENEGRGRASTQTPYAMGVRQLRCPSGKRDYGHSRRPVRDPRSTQRAPALRHRGRTGWLAAISPCPRMLRPRQRQRHGLSPTNPHARAPPAAHDPTSLETSC